MATVTGTLNGQATTFTSPEVARQNGGILDPGQPTSSGVSIQQQTLDANNFLSGSTANSSTSTVAPKSVYTADKATTDLNNKQSDLNAATSAMTTQQQALATPTTTTETPATASDLEKIANPPSDLEKKVSDINAQQDEAYNTFQTQLKQLQQGTFPLTPDQQAMVNATQQQFEQLRNEQKQFNKNYEGGVTLAGIAAGRNRYAPEIELGNIQAAMSAGLQAIAKIDTQATMAISQLRQGFQQQDYEMINAAYSAASDLFKQKTDTIFNMHNTVAQESRDALEKQKYENSLRQAAIQFAASNNITKPFYLVGNTAIDSNTGLPVTLAQYQEATGQQVGAPEDQTDFSHIQNVDLVAIQAIQKMMADYPDAGITPQDTLEQAKSKLANSRIYRRETYIAPSSSNGFGGALTTVGGQGVVAGVKVPAAIASDVEDVLSGRNTLYNIRQTMGRTNAAAAYMQSMRNAIKSIDPQFDFIASDAGGKFVSSTYFQKSKAAIDSVLPNIDKVVDLSNQVGRIGISGVDALLQKGAIQIGNTKVANFYEAQKLIADEIGLALGQGTVSDMKLQLGFDVTDPSLSPEVFASNMALVKQFIENRKAGLDEQRYKSSVDLNTNQSSITIEDPETGEQKTFQGLSPEDIQDAINKGFKIIQ